MYNDEGKVDSRCPSRQPTTPSRPWPTPLAKLSGRQTPPPQKCSCRRGLCVVHGARARRELPASMLAVVHGRLPALHRVLPPRSACLVPCVVGDPAEPCRLGRGTRILHTPSQKAPVRRPQSQHGLFKPRVSPSFPPCINSKPRTLGEFPVNCIVIHSNFIPEYVIIDSGDHFTY